MPARPPSSTNLEFFKFRQSNQMNSVRVENISARATIHEVVELFVTLIGSVKSSFYHENSLSSFLEIVFFTSDTATKALCMSGYTVHGTPLFVSPLSASSPNVSTKRQSDDRKNLYVLGLPFSLTKSEFTSLFSRYGTVTHSVILATVDNSSRRRGFVVMSSHEEARFAMTSLTRTQVKGHCLDISWAVVQRSQGFLDGGDRAMLLDLRTSSCSSRSSATASPDIAANSSASSIKSNEEELASLAPSFLPTTIIFVTNLPTLLFSEVKDMSPLFCPFGRIKKLKIIGTLSAATTSSLVEYDSAEVAQEARETLHGQYYVGHQVSACFVRRKSFVSDPPSVSDAAAHYNTHSRPALSHRPSSLLGPLRSCYDAPQQQRSNGFQHALTSFPFRASPRPLMDYRQRNIPDFKASSR